MSKRKKTTENKGSVEEKKVEAYELLRKLGEIQRQGGLIRDKLNTLEQQIAALENDDP